MRKLVLHEPPIPAGLAVHPPGSAERLQALLDKGDRVGGCVCGAVRYRVQGNPVVGTVCHCKFCQKRLASAFVNPVYQVPAREAAGARDARMGGGVNVIQQYLRQRLVDEMHIAIAPVLLGAGERLFEGINLPALGYSCVKHEATAPSIHVVLSRQ